MSFHSPHLLWLLVPLVLLFSWELARHVTRTVTSWPKIARAWAGAFEVSLGAQHSTAEDRPRIWLWFGLASYAFTKDAKVATKVADALESGMVTINHFGIALPETPLGGVKDSGCGDEGGVEGLQVYMQTKFISHLG